MTPHPNPPRSDHPPTMKWSQVNRHHWNKVRQTVLTRDNHTCRINLPGCTTTATQVDHIIPLHQGGPAYDPTNLRATCWNCNRHRPTPTTHTPHHEPW